MTRKKHNKSVYLIDGHALLYRAFYAIQDLSTSKGMPTNAIYGFLNMLRKIIREHEPEIMAVAFDMKAPTFRQKKYEEYKVHRKPMPDNLIPQVPKIKEIIEAYGIKICQMEGYEADDIIATLAKRAEKKGYDVTIVTGDKDALQLVDEKIRVLSPHTTGDKIYDSDEVKNKYGVEPKEMTDLMALIGDTSDNVPGVKGIGKVTASKLINEYGSVEGVYKNIDKISSESVRKKLTEGKEMAQLSRELVELVEDVPVKLDIERSTMEEPDLEQLAEIYKELEFGKLLREISPKEAEEGKYFSLTGEKEIKNLTEKIKKSKIVSFSLGFSGKEIKGIAFSQKEGEASFIPLIEEFKALLKEVMESENVKKIGCDIKSDILLLRKLGIDLKGVEFDVMIADYLTDPSRSRYFLEDIAMREADYNLQQETTDMEWGKGGQAQVDFSRKEKSVYACERSDVTLRLYDILKAKLKKKKLDPLFKDVEMPLVSVLADMEEAGVGIDIKYLKEKSREIDKELKSLTSKIYKLAGEEFNINSPKQLQVILYEKLGLPVTKKTKTGASTDESVLKKLASLHELPLKLLKYREMNKLKTAYYDSIIEMVESSQDKGPLPKLHARFNQAVTATGRLSSSEPNLQNIPIKTELGKEIRKAFIPSSGENLLLAADYSQVELRILAHLSKDKKLIKAFKEDQDVHRFTASLIFDCDVSKVTDQMRSAAKTVNFGIAYGMSPFGLAKDLDIPVEEARKFITSYFNRYSGVSSFIDKTIEKAKEEKFVTTLLERRRYIPEINSPNEQIKGFAERVAVNTPVQGSAADLIKLAMIALSKEFKGTDIKMIIQVHDELVFDVPKENVQEASKKIRKIMEGVIKLEVPLKVDIEKGKNWLEMKAV